MPVPQFYSHKDFLHEYTFPRIPARDFECDGFPAQFALGHPWGWDILLETIDFGKETKGDDQVYTTFQTALSSDQKLLAISATRGSILIYDIASKELRASLDGTGAVAFRPSQGIEKPGYTLISSISYDQARGAVSPNELILWDLDQHGRVLDEEEPIDASVFASKAIEAILPGLISDHEWTRDFARTSTLHADFEKALDQAAACHRRRHQTIISDARLGNFGSTTFSNDGRLLLYHGNNMSTQQGMREPDRLPQLIVYDIEEGKELYRLRGHRDAIMWAAISPDQCHIASVSWDGTMRMYSMATGDLIWTTDDSGGQSWTGAFTPDSKHIVWSSSNGLVLQVHDVTDGRKVSAFPEKTKDRCRHFAWHPAGEQLAFCAGKHAYIWKPFEGPHGTIVQHFLLDDEKGGWSMAFVETVNWMDDGRILALEFSEGTKLAYDAQTNTKELFMRPKGVQSACGGSGFYGVLKGDDEQEFYICVDGDAKVRYCRTSVPPYPSWWEKSPEEKPKATPKPKFPETGKYVKITRIPSKEVSKKNGAQVSGMQKEAEHSNAE